MSWEKVRDNYAAAVAEVHTALEGCRNEEDFRLILEIMARYPDQALADLRRSSTTNRIAEMRAAVSKLKVTMASDEQPPKDPKKK